MTKIFYYISDLSYIFFYIFLILTFFMYFIFIMSDKYILFFVFQDLMKFKNKHYSLTNDIKFKDFNSVMLAKMNMEFLLFLIIINTFTYFLVFKSKGECIFNPYGAFFSIDINSISCCFLMNFILFLFCFIFFFYLKKLNFLKPTYTLLFCFKFEEFFVFYFLHFISFFIWNCGDVISFYISIELLSFLFFIYLSLYNTEKPLASLKKYSINYSRVEASIKYLIPNIFSSICLLSGFCGLYFLCGTLRFSELFLLLKYSYYFNENFIFVKVFLILIFFSFCFKLSVAPFHNWIINVYEGALQHVVFFLSTFSKFIYFLLFLNYIFPFFLLDLRFSYVFLIVGVFSITIASVYGIFETKFHNLLAYSGILTIGYCFIGLSFLDLYSQVLVLYFFFIYIIFMLLLFGLLIFNLDMRNGFIKNIYEFKKYSDLNLTFYLIIISIIFSIIGIPPFPGFYPKMLLGLNLLFLKNYFIFILYMLCVVFSSFFYLRWISFLNIGVDFKYGSILSCLYRFYDNLFMSKFVFVLIFFCSYSYFVDIFMDLFVILISNNGFM